MTITNPILPGFHPDPCLCRIGGDYYLVTSTFEWAPGVAVFHSNDLAAWQPIGHLLTDRRLLDLEGVPDSGGIWAPALSHHDDLFWLVFTVTHQWGATMDTHNFLTTARAIDGPWTDPVPLNRSGFDPSLYHAPDGRKWLLTMRWDHRPGHEPFAGILMQEMDVPTRRLVGSPRTIFSGTSLGRTEGPHLYWRKGWHYLIVAEGGTEYGHAVTVARSRALEGPYEISPRHPLLSSRNAPEAPLQKTGHGSLVEGPDGSHYLAFLCGRPLPGTRCCHLGRETCLARVRWTEDEWLEVEGGPVARLEIPPPSGPAPSANPAVFASGECIRFS